MSAPPPRPPPLGLVVGCEALERFSFYGVASALVLYLNEHLLFPERDAKAHYHAFLAATWLAPLLGAWVAERLLGRYRSIVGIGAAYVLGLVVLAAFESRGALAVGLALVALGAGALKPCLSAFVGDQLHGEAPRVRERTYAWLSRAANGAAVLAAALVPALLVSFGPRLAFTVPAMTLALALALLVAGRDRYAVPPPAGPNPHGFLRVVARAVSRLGTGHPGQHWLDLARDAHPAEAVEGAKAVLRVAAVFAGVAVCWTLFDQKGSAWVFQARQMDRAVLGHQLSPAQLQALAPLFAAALLPLLGRGGVRGTRLRRVTVGMFATALSFAVAAVVQILIDAGRAPHALWQIPQYLLLGAGEVLVAVTALELGFSQAPRAMRSTVISIWFVTMSAGNLLTVLVTRVLRLEGAAWFWFFAAVMVAAAVAFRAIARGWRVAPEDEIVAE